MGVGCEVLSRDLNQQAERLGTETDRQTETQASAFPQNTTCMHKENIPQFHEIASVKSTCGSQGIGLVTRN